MNQATLDNLRKALPLMPPAEKAEVLEILEILEHRETVAKARNSFLDFVLYVDKDYKVGLHHRRLIHMLEMIETGEKTRIAVAIAPRFGKSMLISHYFPAWFLGRNSNKKIIMASHTADLAVDFGRKVRNLIDSDTYREVFPDVHLSQDSKSAGRWHTDKGGEYFAVGIGGALAGRGADLLLIDDPHNEQDIVNGNTEVFEKAYEWFTSGARTRLMPGGRVALVQTRWALNDLTGKLVKDMNMNPGADQYDVVEFPAILETPDGPKSLWPEQWTLEQLLQTKASMPTYQWNAQYQQNPTSEEGALVKREWWKEWESEDPPPCEFILQAWDTAFEEHSRADYSACTTWGVFYHNKHVVADGFGKNRDKGAVANIILLNAFRDRMEFPELKRTAFEHYNEWKPDALIVEKKASGAPLIYELRAMGLIVGEFTPSKGNDKISRLNSVSDIFASGMVWAPRTRWAEEVMDEVAAFPNGEHDDYVDSCTLALMRFRQGGFVRLESDWKDEPRLFKSKRAVGYY